jgi:hydrogenase small subunit
MTRRDDGIYASMVHRGMSRRTFLTFSAAMAAVLALPNWYAPRIAAAVAAAPRMPVIWLRGQACGGDGRAFMQASKPSSAELLLGLLSVEYHETIMARAGEAAEDARRTVMTASPHGYIAVVEGAIPMAADGAFCTIGGRALRDVVREVCAAAAVTIAVGSCAFDGGAPAAAGGLTGSIGVGQLVPEARLVNLPGCPVNVDNLSATIVHYLTFKELPPTDARRRPLFAYGNLLHNQCERRAHFEFGEFVRSWGDEGAQKGWCLYRLGCKGPETFANCPTVRYADGTSWAVKAGHGCIGCTMPGFWDAMSPVYGRLPAPLPFAPGISAEQLGLALVGGVTALAVAHGAASGVRLRRWGIAERRARAAVLAVPGVAGVAPVADVSAGVTGMVEAPISVDLSADGSADATSASAAQTDQAVDVTGPAGTEATRP